DVLSAVAEEIPPGKLKFALGIGTPADIVACRDMGWELFDCVIPTREGRHGRVFSHLRDDFTYRQTNLTAAAAAGEEAIEEGCDCGCAGYSRAYLRHLFTVGDPLAGTICAGHNLRFFNRLCERLAARERGSGRGIMKKSK
ncbi:MAG TPA: tRNA-guanine transglycosylase, partial [Candidatus Moranbacteria bacterium]|nr:tRNA-guanine transglycosylase [Candidatus Moranbacteria bacterium]